MITFWAIFKKHYFLSKIKCVYFLDRCWGTFYCIIWSHYLQVGAGELKSHTTEPPSNFVTVLGLKLWIDTIKYRSTQFFFNSMALTQLKNKTEFPLRVWLHSSQVGN